MKTMLELTASLLILAVTFSLFLADPLRAGVDYGVKRGWIKAGRFIPRP